MKSPLVIFGSGDLAELAYYYFSTDSDYHVVAFTLDEAYLDANECCGLPVVPFDRIVAEFPPSRCAMFLALSYSNLNLIRKEKYLTARSLGYRIPSYVSSQATLLTNKPVGENCFILEGNTIQPFVSIGNNVTIWSGNHIGHHSTIGDHSFIASQVVVSGGVEIGEQCFIGVNATLRDHITVGDRCVIGAGALLLGDAKDDGVYIGRATERSRLLSSNLRGI